MAISEGLYSGAYLGSLVSNPTISISPPALTDGALVVFVLFYSGNDTESCTGVTWNGTAMTAEGAQNNNYGTSRQINISAWSLINPTADGTSRNLSVTFSTGVRSAACGYFFINGADQTDFASNFVSNLETGTSSAATVNITSANANAFLPAAAVLMGGSSGGNYWTPGTGMTEEYDDATGTGNFVDFRYTAIHRTEASTGTYALASTGSSNNRWVIAGLEVKEATTAGVNINTETAVVEIAPQAVAVDLGTPPEININAATAVVEIAPQAVTIDLGVTPGVNIDTATAVVEIAPQAVGIELGIPGIDINAATAVIEIAPQAVSLDLGTPPAGINIEVITAAIEIVAQPVTVYAPGAAKLIGVPIPLPLSADSQDQVDHNLGTISHSVVASSNPGAQGVLLRSSDSGYVQLLRLGLGVDPQYPLDVVGDVRLTGWLRHTGDLNIEAAGGDILLRDTNIQAHDWISGTTGWGIQHNIADFRNITADSLTVEAFIADINLALAGSQFITKSLAVISRPFTVPMTTATLYVFDLPGFANTQVFEDGDTIRLRHIDRSGGGLVVADVWGTVSSYADLSGGEQSWTFSLLNGTVGQLIHEGGIALDYGVSGNGYWHVTTLDPAGSPYAQIGTWTSDPANPTNHQVHVRMGQLDGITGIGNEWGFWAGSDTDKYLLASDSHLEAHGMRLSLYDTDGEETVRLDPNAPYLAIGDPLPTGPSTGGPGLWVGQEGGAYPFRLGDPTGVSLRYTAAGSLLIRNASNQNVIVLAADGSSYFDRPMTLGTTGGIWQGTGSFATPTTGLKIWRDGDVGRIGGYNAGVLQWYANNDGKLYAASGDVVIDENGLSLTAGTIWHPRTSIEWIPINGTTAGSNVYAINNVPTGSNPRTTLILSTKYNSDTNYIYLHYDKTILTRELEVTGGITVKEYPSSSGFGNVDYEGNLISRKGASGYTVYAYRPIAPVSSSGWGGDAKTGGSVITIPISGFSGVPSAVQAVNIHVVSQMSSQGHLRFGGSFAYPEEVSVEGSGWQRVNGIVRVISGNIYFYSNVNINQIWVSVNGYFI